MQLTEKTYYSKREFEKGTKKMQKRGWTIYSVDVRKERPCACCLLGLFSFLLPSAKVYDVIYKK